MLPSPPDPAALVASHPSLTVDAQDGLVFEGVPLRSVIGGVGTPCWVYGAQTMRGRMRALSTALRGCGAHIHYAVKANDHLAILALVAAEGAGADVVSGGELARALRAGIPPHRIVFSGIGKSRAEIAAALAAGIAQINVESAEEVEIIAGVATAENRVATITVRVNPDVDAGTHAKISTGRHGDKFGVPIADAVALYARAATMPGLRPVGLAVHIGSQIADLLPFRAAYRSLAEMVTQLRGQGREVLRIDCGGGLGIGYDAGAAASTAAYAGLLTSAFGSMDLELQIEPGRWLVGPAGLLLSRVILRKQALPQPFLVLDAAMNDLLRPALYDAWHGIVPISPLAMRMPLHRQDVVGPVCESSDIFARGRPLPSLGPGDAVAILDCGAYGATMSSTYNARPLAAQVMVDGATWGVIRRRQAIEDLWRSEIMPREPRAPGS